jgi:hypothetical protein
MNPLYAKPILKKLPNSHGVTAMNKKVVVCLFGLLAKWAKPTILEITLPQAVRRPKPILEGQPSVVLHLGGSPSFPNNLVHARFNETK